MNYSTVSQDTQCFGDAIELPSQAHRCAGRIMVLDDMKEILRLISRFAQMEGFSSIPVESNADALAHIQDEVSFTKLRMAFLDIEVGPDLGFDVYHAIRRKNTELPVVIMSGSAYHKRLYPIMAEDEHVSFLPKPFDMKTIRHLIREPLAWAGDIKVLFQTDPTLGYRALVPVA